MSGERIVLEIGVVPGWVCLLILDNGGGIPEADVESLLSSA